MHNEHKVLDQLIAQLQSGKKIALLSDAGAPGSSDPGFLLVRACKQQGIPVTCLPGATAFVPALVQSGIPCNNFIFEGFIPLKKGRQTFFQGLVEEKRTVVIYESPHRLIKTLTELQTYIGDERLVAVCRELSKMFEETKVAPLPELIPYFETKGVKGEIVIVIAGK